MTHAITILGLSAGIFIIYHFFSHERGPPLPPGPSRWPIIGNLLDIPAEKEWLTYEKWGKIWGDLVSVSVLGQEVIIVNSTQLAVDMLEKKGTIYSERPIIPMGGELVGWKNIPVLLPYKEQLKNNRKLFHRTIGTTKMVRYYPVEEIEAHKFLKRLVSSPQNLVQHIRQFAGAIILRITYGYGVEKMNDPFVVLADRAMEQFSRSTTPGSFLVNLIPSLARIPDWFPGAGFKKTAQEWAETLNEMIERPHQYAAGSASPSFTSTLLAEPDTDLEKEHSIKLTAAALYAGGTDTTVSSVYAFFKAMVLYPEVAAAAQAEIDSVVGSDRLPSFTDREHLPYINALVLELMRWNTPTPTGIPHVVKEDDIHNGYLIPKGAVIIPNIWKMLHDPTVYSDPMTFNPERFLGPQPEPDPRKMFFGFGRRICPGRALADASLFISCAMTLAVFDISTFIDEFGKAIDPVVDQTPGMISHPSPFLCQIKPRCSKALSLIDAETESPWP